MRYSIPDTDMGSEWVYAIAIKICENVASIVSNVRYNKAILYFHSENVCSIPKWDVYAAYICNKNFANYLFACGYFGSVDV